MLNLNDIGFVTLVTIWILLNRSLALDWAAQRRSKPEGGR